MRELDEPRADDIVLATREGLAAIHKPHALDALISATALINDAELVTCDAHFKGLPWVG